MVEMTQEEKVQKDYLAAMDSVNLLNGTKPEQMTDSEWQDCIQRNKDHLAIQVAKGSEYYGSNDLTPFTAAIAKE